MTLGQRFNIKSAPAMAAMVLAGALSGCAMIGTTPQPLTEGEKRLSRSIFGPQLNTAIVKKYLVEKDDKCADAQAFWTRFMLFYKSSHAVDYSDKTASLPLGFFVHEMTHIWQAQNWSLMKQFAKRCSTYNYALTARSRFDDFCNEQQAAMVQDYARYYLTENPSFPTRLLDKENQEVLALLPALIEKTFPGSINERRRTEAMYPDAIRKREQIVIYQRENNIRTRTVSVCQ